MKRCNKCGEEKPLAEFYKSSGGRDGRRPECKACTRARRRRWYQENREREIDRVRAWQRRNHHYYLERQSEYRKRATREHRSGHLKRKFGLTAEEFEALAAFQGGRCALCGDSPADGQNLHVDHDPVTKMIRGLLCVRCNNGLGQFKEDGHLLCSAADYVESGGFGCEVMSLHARARMRAFELKRSGA